MENHGANTSLIEYGAKRADSELSTHELQQMNTRDRIMTILSDDPASSRTGLRLTMLEWPDLVWWRADEVAHGSCAGVAS
jgi:hypothetical protein